MQNIHGGLVRTWRIKKRMVVPRAVLSLGDAQVRVPFVALLAGLVAITVLLSLLFQSWSVTSAQKAQLEDYRQMVTDQSLANLQLDAALKARSAELKAVESEFEAFKRQVDVTLAKLAKSVEVTLSEVKSGD